MLLYKLRKLILDGIIYLVNRVNIVNIVIFEVCFFVSLGKYFFIVRKIKSGFLRSVIWAYDKCFSAVWKVAVCDVR